MGRLIKVYEFTAPAYWAPLLINGDDSGMEHDDIEACNAWTDTLPGPVCGCKDDEEPFFTRYHDARAFNSLANDCITYIIHEYEAEEPND